MNCWSVVFNVLQRVDQLKAKMLTEQEAGSILAASRIMRDGVFGGDSLAKELETIVEKRKEER